MNLRVNMQVKTVELRLLMHLTEKTVSHVSTLMVALMKMENVQNLQMRFYASVEKRILKLLSVVKACIFSERLRAWT